MHMYDTMSDTAPEHGYAHVKRSHVSALSMCLLTDCSIIKFFSP